MGININEKYEIAYDFYGKILEEIDADSLNERISLAIEKTIESMSLLIEDTNSLRDYLLSRISREKEEDTVSVMLGEEAENSTWWDEYRAENATELKFWNRYSKYLFERKHWEKSAITKSIGNPTDMLLNAIADPNRATAQEKRAMVVGYVQSGKTANYIGLINKALDAGYKYIIVLAGIHNNLRSQTQSRIDEEVLGYETSSEARQKQRERAEKNRIGVGTLYNAGFVQTLTFRDESGDFSKKNSSWDTHPDVPTIIVTKKIKSTLTNLIENIESKQVVKQDENGHFVMPAKYPLLLIDDEADQASVNTGYDYDENGNIIDEYDVKTINRLIRNLLNHFECKSYVGYTATPYANIFIPNDLAVASGDLGNDLFPADCIISLPKPYRYIGANEFFGYGTEDEEPKPMPLVRKIQDEDFVDTKKKTVGDLPDSLKKAMKCFLVSVAIRNCRGEMYRPNTMLIHVARIKNMHKQLERKVSEYFFDELQSMIIDGDSETKKEIYDIIRQEYLPISEKMRKDFSRYMEDAYDVNADDIYEEIVRLMNEDKVKINVINGDSKDVLCYKDHEGEEYNVIAIGGDKFSRGLTLEGLSISYFTRESKYYDTLMQMGRWFGFRPKYADLCRVFITDNIYRWFARIAFATDNLRNQITYMCDEKAKPRDFGLRVATHPELKISSPKKVKSGTMQQLDFSTTLTVTRDIDVNIEMYESNYRAVDHLFSYAERILTAEDHFTRLGRKTDTEHYFIENVNSNRIIEFFRNYQTSKRARKVNGNNIATYIEEQNKDGLLVNWTVCLINTGNDVPGFDIAGIHIKNGITRKSENSIVPQEDTCSVHIDYLKKGIIYLHGKMPENVKEYLEYKFSKSRELKVLVANKVVLEGVNLPVNSLFIMNGNKLKGKDLMNLIGRVNRLNEVFGQRNDLSKLMPKIHFVNSDEYNRKNGKLENKMRLLKTTVFPDDVKNPLLINFDMENCKKANMQERCKAIIDEENQFFSENEDEIQRFKKKLISVGINQIYDLSDELCNMIYTKIKKLEKHNRLRETHFLDRLRYIFIRHADNYIVDDEFRRLNNDQAIAYYKKYFNDRKLSLKQRIAMEMKFFKSRIEQNNSIMYIGESYGDFAYSTNGRASQKKVYIDLSQKSEKQLTNIAIVKQKLEDDFVGYKLNMFFQLMYDTNILTKEEYQMIVYGTTDKKKMDLIKMGLTINVINRLEEDKQIENIEIDINNNLSANDKFYAYKKKVDDFYRFELDKFL